MAPRFKHKRSVGARIRTRVLIVLAILIVALGAAGFELYREGQEIKTQSSNVVTDLTSLSGELSSGNLTGVQETAEHIAKDVDQMSATVSNPLWQLASTLPVIGTDVQNVRALVHALQDVSDQGISPVAQAAASTDQTELVAAFGSLDAAIERTRQLLATLPEGSLTEVNNALARAREFVQRAPSFEEVIDTAAGVSAGV